MMGETGAGKSLSQNFFTKAATFRLLWATSELGILSLSPCEGSLCFDWKYCCSSIRSSVSKCMPLDAIELISTLFERIEIVS